MYESHTRYIRQVSLPGLGSRGQQQLAGARVLVVGAGGLGCPVIQYLAGAGVGTLGIADGDLVELSNLHRQPLFTTADIGKPKAMIAAERIHAFNQLISCIPHKQHVTNQNALTLFEGYDMVVDCTDNFTARYAINDACFLLQKPLVFAAVFQYEGQVAVFNSTGTPRAVNYRDLFPEPPSQGSVPDCNIAGVLGVLPGLIGIMQATEVIKLITGIGEPLSGKLLNYDIRTHTSNIFELTPTDEALLYMPADRSAFEKMDYQWLCGEGNDGGIEKQVFDEFLSKPSTLVVDLREAGEEPTADFPHLSVPMSRIEQFPEAPEHENIVLFCQTGKRSAKAVEILKRKFGASKAIYHLNGGLAAYYQQEHG